MVGGWFVEYPKSLASKENSAKSTEFSVFAQGSVSTPAEQAHTGKTAQQQYSSSWNGNHSRAEPRYAIGKGIRQELVECSGRGIWFEDPAGSKSTSSAGRDSGYLVDSCNHRVGYSRI